MTSFREEARQALGDFLVRRAIEESGETAGAFMAVLVEANMGVVADPALFSDNGQEA